MAPRTANWGRGGSIGCRYWFGGRQGKLMMRLWIACLALIGPLAGSLAAIDHVVIKQATGQRQVDGRVLVTAVDGGILLLAADGMLWTAEPSELVERTSDDTPFEPLSPADLGKRLLTELPPG